MLDLFSGAGGLSEGFKRASAMRTATRRYSTVRAVEFDRAAAASYEANHGRSKVFAGAIEDWLATEDVPEADLIIGGPPCQGFSALGKKDVHDQRNRLWEYYAQTISKANPRFFVLENVPRFLGSTQYAQFEEMCSPGGALRDYAFQAKILNAAEHGAAQVRKRVILIGHHRDLPFPGFPEVETRFKDPANWRTLRSVLEKLPETVRLQSLPDRWYEFEGETLAGAYRTDELHVTRHYEEISLKRFAFIKEGENRFKLPEDLKSNCWRNHTTGSADVMGRLWWNRPSVTIRTEFFKPEKGRYLHPSEPRALTHQEAARIQGFRDTYKWVGSKTAIARQIGNAVPIPLGKALGQHLMAAFPTA
ncbi:DNA cytosine methyltransferase [Jiangella muralis]|uniref:DNA cytosine methyltransferase n=1 Tax=Jiangella muralis TaxID=702383 RepID=UPI001969CA89|nr:DNA cytosine methyltransferase [Jiangella muralis]